MKFRITGLVLFFFAVAAIAQLNVRNFIAKNDMLINAQQDEDIEWYQAEQVQYDIYVRRGHKRVNIPTNAVPIWRVWASATPTTLVVLSTGTVVNAVDGHVRFTLTPSASNASTGTYVSLVDVAIGSTNIGAIASSAAIIRYSPQSTNVAYSGTVALTSPFYVLTGDTLEGNMNVGGYTITNAGSITSTGTITGNLFSGDGGSLTNISATAVLTPWTGNVNAATYSLTNAGTVAATTLTGAGSGITAVDAATLDTLDSLAFVKADGTVAMSGNLAMGANDITGAGTVTAVTLVGDGRSVTSAIPTYIFVGQSNMTGQPGTNTLWGPIIGSWSNLDENIHFSDYRSGVPVNTFLGPVANTFGPALSAGKSLSAQSGGDEILIIKISPAAQPMSYFAPGGAGYTIITNHIAFATNYYTTNLNRGIDFRRLYWMQGETDALTNTDASVWASNFNATVTQLQTDIGVTTLPATVGVISRPAETTNNATVRAQQMTTTGTWDWVDTERFDRPTDNIHLDAYGLLGLGEMFASHDISNGPWIFNDSTDVFHLDGSVNLRFTDAGFVRITNGNMRIEAGTALSANDKIFELSHPGRVDVFTVDEDGDIIMGNDGNAVVWSGGDLNTYRAFFPDSQYFVAGGVRFLDINEVAGQDNIKWNQPGTADIDHIWRTSTGATNVFIEGSSGFVGIGTDAPSTNLQVVGQVLATSFAGDGSGLTNLSASGNWWTSAPSSAISFPTNAHSIGYVLKSDDETNMYWAADAGASTGGVATVQWGNTNLVTDSLVLDFTAADFVVSSNAGQEAAITLSADVGMLSEASVIAGNWTNVASPWADNEVADTLTVGSGGSVDDGALSANVAHLNVAETIASNWVNTASPWASNEVVSTITSDAEWDTFAEVQAAVSDKTLLNEEDAATIDAAWTIDNNLTVNSNISFTAASSGGYITDSSGGSLVHYAGLADTTNLVLSIGDTTSGGNSTRMIIDDNSKLIKMQTSAIDMTLQVRGDLDVLGNIKGAITVLDKSAAYTATTNDTLGTIIFCDAASTQTLHDVAAAERHISFYTVGDVLTVITANSNDYIRLDGDNTAAGGSITNASGSGDMVTLLSRNATNWVVIGRSGTWTK